MKLISLNVWQGKLGDQLVGFLEEMSKSTDIFCLQEVTTDLYDKLLKILARHNSHLGDYYSSLDERLAIFIRKGIAVEKINETTLCKNREVEGNEGHNIIIGSKLQYLTFVDGQKNFMIANVHGLWVNRKHKTDTSERITQSKKINKVLDKFNGAKILCGDFNLLPNTESITMIEKNSMKNLIKDYGVATTRSSFFPIKDVKFADYVFTSSEVHILNFKVLKNEVSDHLPLLLEFS
jgi:endonuclease/exonuclease/phosphatase family metal-dependent hydrolase